MTLALDLEGTLISNAVSQIPRPGLTAFLESCSALFDRIVIFTSVSEARFRSVAGDLVSRGEAPSWFADLDLVRWEGRYKRLHFVTDVHGGEAILLDDMEAYIHPEDRERWVPILPFEPPYDLADRELENALSKLRRCSSYRPQVP
jgi:hypothetical protein